MSRVYFQEVTLTGRFVWRENGKRRQRTETFMQTINPFNRNANGLPKTREEIFVELAAERDEWLKQLSAIHQAPK